VNLLAEIPGKSKTDEVIWVIAGYDAPDAAGAAALMCVAHSLTGSEHPRTIRFAAVMQTAGGLTQLRKDDPSGQKPHTVIALSSAASAISMNEWTGAEILPFAISSSDTPAVLGRLHELQTLIERSADQP
jgi:hypothetical protein